MTIRVIGAGFPRTGTASLKTALGILGFGPCYHMSEVFAHPEHWPMWVDAAAHRPVDWDALYAEYNATVDAPGCFFYSEISAHWPEAKVVLTSRDPDSWFESTQETILSRELIGRRGGRPPGLQAVFDAIAFDQNDPATHDKNTMVTRMLTHNDAVRRTIAPERLLEFDPARGWGPLCAHLGVPAPDTPYPHINLRSEFRKMGERAKSWDPLQVRRSHEEQLANLEKK